MHFSSYHTSTWWYFQAVVKLTVFLITVQVGAVSVRKDDEVTVVRGTYKVLPHVNVALCCNSCLHNGMLSLTGAC